MTRLTSLPSRYLTHRLPLPSSPQGALYISVALATFFVSLPSHHLMLKDPRSHSPPCFSTHPAPAFALCSPPVRHKLSTSALRSAVCASIPRSSRVSNAYVSIYISITPQVYITQSGMYILILSSRHEGQNVQRTITRAPRASRSNTSLRRRRLA